MKTMIDIAKYLGALVWIGTLATVALGCVVAVIERIL